MLKPLGTNIIVKEVIEELKQGKILLAAVSQVRSAKEPIKGTILAMGPKCEPLVEIGDKVLFDWNEAKDVSVDEHKYLVIDEKAIHAIITEE